MSKCNEKVICQKMRNAGLQCAIDSIVAEKVRDNYKTLLSGTLNLVKSYECLPCSVLVARIEFILQELEKREEEKIRDDEQMLIRMLLKELEVFIKG